MVQIKTIEKETEENKANVVKCYYLRMNEENSLYYSCNFSEALKLCQNKINFLRVMLLDDLQDSSSFCEKVTLSALYR